jgi:prevent-host-death family protein
MEISVSDAKSQLTDLVRQAEAGEEVLLTRHGQPVAKIIAMKPAYDPQKRRAALDRLRDEGSKKITPGPCAARSQDFLYDEFGVPK